MRIKYSSILALAVTVAACGGGGSSGAATQSTNSSGGGNAPPTSQSPTQPKSTGGLIEYYGDSTVWGWKTNSADPSQGERVALPAPAAFAQALPTTPQYTIVNEGASGSTACNLLQGTDGVHNIPWGEQLDKQPTGKWVIINHGINDRIKTNNISTYRTCLTELVTIAKGKGRLVVLETPNPISTAGLEEYARVMREVAAAQDVKMIDQYEMLTKYMSDNNVQLDKIVPDGLHPTEAIYKLKGEYAAEVFSQRLYP